MLPLIVPLNLSIHTLTTAKFSLCVLYLNSTSIPFHFFSLLPFSRHLLLMTFLNFTFQDSSPLISYSAGQWVEGSPTNDTFIEQYSQASYKETTILGATATLTFMGNGITIFGAKRFNHGNYSVILDDGAEFIGNGSGSKMFQFPLWNAQNIANSQHTVVITNIPSSIGDALDLDFVSVNREIGPPGYTGPFSNMTIDDESPFIVYNGSWTPAFSETALNSTLHSTAKKGDSVSLSFQGSSIELYGLYNDAPFNVNLDNELPRDLAGPNVGLHGSAEHPQTLLFYADGLDENQTHNITMTNGVSNSKRPLQFDYAIVRSSQSLLNGTFNPIPESTNTTLSTPTFTSNTINSHPRSVKVGAIVGGVLGGLGLVILVIMGLILRRILHRLRYYESTMDLQTEDSHSIVQPPSSAQVSGTNPFAALQSVSQDFRSSESSS